MYALKSAHSKCTKLDKNAYPHRLDAYAVPAYSRPSTLTTSRTSISSHKEMVMPWKSQENEKKQDRTTLTVESTVCTPVSTSNLSTSSLSITSSLFVTSTIATPPRLFFGNPYLHPPCLSSTVSATSFLD